MKVIFHPDAYDEMLESARFFEEKSPGLGLDLIAAIQDAARRVAKFPKSGVIEEVNIRRCLVHGFPFTILYEASKDNIYVAAIIISTEGPVIGEIA